MRIAAPLNYLGMPLPACSPPAAGSLPYKMAYAIINGMTLKIDKAGRIVVPKPIRARLGLQPGMSLEVLERPEGLMIRPAERRPNLVREGVLLVHTGKLPPGYDLTEAIEQEREARIQEIWSR